MESDSGRQHLSPGILRIVDNLGISYKEMLPGQYLIIHAEDTTTKLPGSFTLEVVSVRELGGREGVMTATLRYKGGDFSFYNGENPAAKPVRLAEGALMESGISGTLVPQTDMRMSYFGGIGLGRDHSFEYIDGQDRSIIVHNLTAIDIGNPAMDWQQPNLTEHFRKLGATKARQEQERKEARQNNERAIEAFIEEGFKNHPLFGQIQEILQGFSPNGKIGIASYLAYALEDGVLEKAWVVLKKACDEHYHYQPPFVRGDTDILEQNRAKLMEMTRDAGIRWPRPKQETKEVNQEGPEVGEISYIKIPEDKDLQAKLHRKLAEYQSRLTDSRLSPTINTYPKIAVLTELLEKGEISSESLRAKLSKESWFDEYFFEVAVWVINEYCRTGGRGRVVGGTGVK